MPEKFRRGQVFRDRSAVNSNKRGFLTVALFVNTAGNILFPRTARTGNQYRHICRSNQTYMLVELAGSLALSLHILAMRSSRQFGTFG